MTYPAVSIGNFFFRHRNWSFPVLIASIFAVALPPSRTFGSEGLEHLKDALAILVAATGLALRALVIGTQYVRRSGENRTIHAADLFTDGMFALCRNPLYTGNVLIVTAVFLMHGDPVVFGLGTAVFWLIYTAMIRAEESYLRGTFGQPYADYCARVPRWIPDPRRLNTALRGMRFNARRVLLVEYTNIGVTTLALTAAEIYEELATPVSRARDGEVHALLAVLVLAVAWIVGVRVLKKRRIIVAA